VGERHRRRSDSASRGINVHLQVLSDQLTMHNLHEAFVPSKKMDYSTPVLP
jgi:hypothetical protein